jgi:hypothetical protein
MKQWILSGLVVASFFVSGCYTPPDILETASPITRPERPDGILEYLGGDFKSPTTRPRERPDPVTRPAPVSTPAPCGPH